MENPQGLTYPLILKDDQHIVEILYHCPVSVLEKRWQMRITRTDDGDWLLSKDNITLTSPTPLYYHVGSEDFRNKFERHFQIEPNDVCLDVGACIGDTTVAMALKTTGKIIAVEPEETNIRYLKLNTQAYPNVQIIEKAAFNKQGSMPLYSTRGIAGSSLVFTEKRANPTQVETDTLDNMLDEQEIDYAKIDAQGAEPEILEGASHLLATVKKLAIFIHNRDTMEGSTLPRILPKLFKHDFKTNYEAEVGVLYACRK